MQKKVKAVALVSSGLDSMLAVKIIKNQGIDVYGLSLTFRFDSVRHRKRANKINELEKELGIPVRLIDKSEKFLEIVKYPKHGYGSEMNPCIDCRIQMLQIAEEYMKETGADFIVTGEVVGQRPMSQQKPTIYHIDKVTGLRGLIVRPLSAKLLPETIPEQKGWINSEELFDFHGRSRKDQLELAKKFGLKGFEPPAGGCSLTTPDFSRRLSELFSNREKENIRVQDLELLLYGRHFWPYKHLNIVVGRDENDNIALESLKIKGALAFMPADDISGPFAIAVGVKNNDDIKTAASLVARYTNRYKSKSLRVEFIGLEKGSIEVEPADEKNVKAWRI